MCWCNHQGRVQPIVWRVRGARNDAGFPPGKIARLVKSFEMGVGNSNISKRSESPQEHLGNTVDSRTSSIFLQNDAAGRRFDQGTVVSPLAMMMMDRNNHFFVPQFQNSYECEGCTVRRDRPPEDWHTSRSEAEEHRHASVRRARARASALRCPAAAPYCQLRIVGRAACGESGVVVRARKMEWMNGGRGLGRPCASATGAP